MKHISRRTFLGQASCASVGSTALFSTLFNLKMAGNAMGATLPAGNDYKALVCVFLAGGNDSFNMLVPYGSSEHAEYQSIRTDLAIPTSGLSQIKGTHSGKTLSVHAGMPEVKTMFDNDELAFVANVGTLVEPVTKTGFFNSSAKLPVGLFSHSDQIGHWQTSVPEERGAIGWGGRMADLLSSVNSNQSVSMNITVSGSNVFQAGANTAEYSVDPGTGPLPIEDFDEPDIFSQIRKASVDSLLDQEYQNLFQQTYANNVRKSIDVQKAFSAALAAAPTLTTVFSPTELSSGLNMIARIISARNILGMRRQTFFVLVGGWDHHDEVINAQGAMLPMVSKALGEFNAAMKELNVHNDVTTFTASDFGRTLTSNGKGSDHAWGGNHIVMGGAVNGGQVYGTYPDLFADNPLDTGRGRLIPTTSVDEYFAELALWYGVSTADVDQILPNIRRFYTPSGVNPLGFMS